MSRVNFYQLLELKINPPESNPEVIEAAIKRKQSEWSRLRNHPTKGTQARQYISLLTDIRKTMGDPESRKNEARNALELLKKKLESKFQNIDSHVFLLGSKGEIYEEEIKQLAEFHKVKPQIIQRRVDRWRKKHGHPIAVHLNHLLISERPDDKAVEKIASQFETTVDTVRKILKNLLKERSDELDAYINIQIRKGFMAEKEISTLSEIYALDQGEILRRVRCPIKKGTQTDSDHDAYQIDTTVEQVINENLKIVEQESLYSFLSLFPGSTLETLQKKAVEKEKEIRKIAQKDAFVTASGVLAGQCISIFKSDESRYAYDLSRARSLLKNLNKDIGLAVNQNSIRLEYYHHLLRKAVSFGTIPDEARQHILTYCNSKGWDVELPKKKRNLKRYVRLALVTSTLFVLSLAVFWYFYFSNQRLEEEYLRTVKNAGSLPSLEEQITVFETYLAQSDKDEYRERASKHIESLQKRLAQKNYHDTVNAAEALYAQKRYEEAGDLFKQFLSKFGSSAWAGDIRTKADEIPGLIDKRDYQRISDMPLDNPEAVAHAGAAYLRQHPEGRYIAEVQNILKKVEVPYYQAVEKALPQCEKQGDWGECIRLCSRYIAVYRDSRYALSFKEKRDGYQIRLQNNAIIDELFAKAGGKDAEPEHVRTVFENFLRTSSNSPAAPLVQSELAKIQEQLVQRESQQEKARLDLEFGKKGSRFVLKKEEAFYDTKSGLTWMLLDSRMLSGRCMTYVEARRYVKAMKLGGYSDWRLPKAKELTGLLSAPSPFPGASSEWYWSSDSFKRYSGGWIILVDVVSPLPKPMISKQDSNSCGWFRAVRP